MITSGLYMMCIARPPCKTILLFMCVYYIIHSLKCIVTFRMQILIMKNYTDAVSYYNI